MHIALSFSPFYTKQEIKLSCCYMVLLHIVELIVIKTTFHQKLFVWILSWSDVYRSLKLVGLSYEIDQGLSLHNFYGEQYVFSLAQ